MAANKRVFIYAGIFMVLLVLPFVISSSYVMHLIITLCIFGILALGLEIPLGLTGLFSMGHAAFYGMGAYVSALLAMKLGMSFWAAMVVSMASAGLLGLALGFPCLRLKGDYLAIATLGFGEIFRILLVNWDQLTRGPMGLPGIPRPSVFGWFFSGRIPYYYLILILFALSFWVAWRLPHTYLGRSFKAVRDDEDAAGFMGIHVAKYKIVAFIMGGVYAGLAGSFYAHYITFISPDTFMYQDSTLALCMVFLGGAGTIIGPVIGAFVLVIIPELLRFLVEWRMLVVGVIMVVMMIYRPQGIMGGRGRKISFKKSGVTPMNPEKQQGLGGS